MPHHHKDIIGALLLITLGIVLFLNNLGLLPWSIWPGLFKFWPVLLILAGIQTILGRSAVSQIVMFLLTVFVFFFIIGFLARPDWFGKSDWQDRSFIPLIPDVFQSVR